MKFSKISQLDALAFCFKTGYTISTEAVEPRPGPLHLTKEAFPMSEEDGPDFITLVDEDGNNIEQELTGELEHKGCRYMHFFTGVEGGADGESEDSGLGGLWVIEEDGEELLSARDSDEELSEGYDRCMERLFQEEDEDGEAQVPHFH